MKRETDYAKLPYSIVLQQEETGGYSTRVLELPGCFSEGESAKEAVKNTKIAIEHWIDAAKINKTIVPYPNYMHKQVYINCACQGVDHLLRVHYLDHEHVFVDVVLVKFGFWKRVWLGIKYIFGKTPRYGHYEEFMLHPETVKQMKEFLEEYLKYYEAEINKPMPTLEEIYHTTK